MDGWLVAPRMMIEIRAYLSPKRVEKRSFTVTQAAPKMMY
jgi:hypothetical protein